MRILTLIKDRCDQYSHTPVYCLHHDTAEELESFFKRNAPGFVYTRLNNPTIEAFERRIAFLEGRVGAVACSSGNPLLVQFYSRSSRIFKGPS